MWFLIACMTETCSPPQPMPSVEVCQTVGRELRRTMFGSPKSVVCVNGQTGERIVIRES